MVATATKKRRSKDPPAPLPPGHSRVDRLVLPNSNSLVRGMNLSDAQLIDQLGELRIEHNGHWSVLDKALSLTLEDAPMPLDAQQRADAEALIQKYSQRQEIETRPQQEPGDIIIVELARLQRHPDNREPTKAEIAERAESLAAEGQLEPVVIRGVDWHLDQCTAWQILSGETRVLAARSLGWKTIKARVITCDDARALELLAEYNAQRKDLNPIQKARLIVALCERNECTREAAGKRVGLKSGSAASNLVRLLELPPAWLERVASGELPESWAREILKVVKVPEAIKDLEREWKERQREDRPRWQDSPFDSREILQDAVEQQLSDHVRLLTEPSWTPPNKFRKELGYGPFQVNIPAETIEANRAKLKIVTVTSDGEQYEAATNCELFDELRAEAVRKHLAEKAAKKTRAAGKAAGEPAVKVERTKQEIEYAAQQRAQQLGRNLEDWKDRLMRIGIAEKLGELKLKKDVEPRLLTLALHYWSKHDGSSFDLSQIISGENHWRRSPYQHLRQACDKAASTIMLLQEKVLAMVQHLVAAEAPPKLDEKTRQAIFDDWGCDLAESWRKLHPGTSPHHAMLEEFFEHHRKGELIPLAKELGVHLEESWGKPQMIKVLLTRSSPLPLPKCLQPEKKRTAKKGGKS